MGKSEKVVESIGCRSWWFGRIVRDLSVTFYKKIPQTKWLEQ